MWRSQEGHRASAGIATMENRPGRSVLVVDDDPAVRTMLARLLEVHGYHVSVARDAETALALIATQDIDIVVSDVVMPGRSGLELRREIESQSGGTPVILISGYSPDGPAEAARAIGRTRFVQKPFSVDVLVGVIEEMLDQSDPA